VFQHRAALAPMANWHAIRLNTRRIWLPRRGKNKREEKENANYSLKLPMVSNYDHFFDIGIGLLSGCSFWVGGLPAH